MFNAVSFFHTSQLLLVQAKIRCAELEGEKDEQRGKARKLTKQLNAMGGNSMQVAQRLTQLEVRLAASEQTTATLREHNAHLERDVVALIEARMELAEAKEIIEQLQGDAKASSAAPTHQGSKAQSSRKSRA